MACLIEIKRSVRLNIIPQTLAFCLQIVFELP